jgi:hypothetical protein
MAAPDRKARTIISRLCQDLDKDLAVFFDEADLLTGAGLLTFLAQIRDGYNARHKPGNEFPRSLALVGTRDIRDYSAPTATGSSRECLGSPFNIVTERMTLANFTEAEVGTLYRQHTEATGQRFEDSAITRAWHWTEGQPWLVNGISQSKVYQIGTRSLTECVPR